jgi:signal transduction histidine kinase
MLAQRASRELAAGTLEPGHIDVLEENARAALAETRALVASSASPGLDDGLASALERLGARFERETGIIVTVQADATAFVARDTEVVLLRCAQEGLANVRKHAAAHSVTVSLTGRTLRVIDDGTGFDVTAPSAGYGLAGMRERLALVGGSVQITTASSGTVLEVEVPA